MNAHKMIIKASTSVLLLKKRTKTNTIMHRQEMSIPVMECNIVFSFFKKFEKVVNTFGNSRDMHAFPTIQNKIQVKDDNNDLFIGNIFESFLGSARKEAYEKASLEHEQSKDNKDIFLEKMIRRMQMKSSSLCLPKLELRSRQKF